MHRAGLIIGWLSVGYVVLIGALTGLLVVMAGPPPNGPSLVMSLALTIALPALPLMGMILAMKGKLAGLLLLGLSGLVLALHSTVLSREINPFMASVGVLIIASALMMRQGSVRSVQ